MGHLVFGLVTVCAGLCGVFVWFDDFGRVLRGVVPLGLIVLGLVAMGAGLGVRKKRPDENLELSAQRVPIHPGLGTRERQSSR